MIIKKRLYISVLIATSLLLSIPSAFSESVVTQEIESPIICYGEDAKAFAQLIAQYETSANIVVVSDLENVDLKALGDALENDGIIVAINLAIDNKLVPVPSVVKTTNRELLKINSETQSLESKGALEISTETIYPNYWISVIKKDSKADFILIQENSKTMRDKISLAAADAVGEAVQTTMLLGGGTDNWEKMREYSQLVQFGTNMEDEFYIRHEIYELTSYDTTTTPDTEYWRTDSYIDSYIPEYECSLLHVGPYIAKREIIVDAVTWIPEVYKYSPISTNVDVGVDVDIGFSISPPSGGGLDIGYGWSWENPGVKYEVAKQGAYSKVTTDEIFREPDYILYPYIIEPTPPSHYSYATEMTNVMRTAVGSGFDIEQLKSTWWINDDHILWYGLLFVFRDTYSYSLSWNPTPITSLFS